MAEFEGAIDFLSNRGLIDASRVGIIGFSRTVYSVGYTLTHSTYHFAAATLADGINAAYFSYMVFPTASDELLNGGPPFGETLVSWLRNSPAFNLDKVQTPVRLESYGLSGGVLSEWEWFSGLSRLRKGFEYEPFLALIRGEKVYHTTIDLYEKNLAVAWQIWFISRIRIDRRPALAGNSRRSQSTCLDLECLVHCWKSPELGELDFCSDRSAHRRLFRLES